MVNRNHFCALLAGVLFITFMALSPSLKNPFCHLDDQVHVLENPAIRGLDLPHLKAMFTRTVSKVYIPLTYVSYALEYQFFEYRPFIYHLVNLLLHLGVTGMVFILGLRLGLSLLSAALGSLIFGVHPMHVESVVWITERKDVLYSFFYLLSVYHFLNFLEARERHNQDRDSSRFGTVPLVPYLWSLVFGLSSILSKPMAVSLPLVLGIFDWFKKRRFSAGIVIEKIPYVLVIVPIAWVTYAFHARIPGRSFYEGGLTWIWSLTFYFKKFFFPFDVYPAYTMPSPVSVFEPEFLGAVLIFILLWACLFQLRKERWFIFGFLYFFASIFFLLRYDDVWDAQIVADRFMYLPSLGLCLWLGHVGNKVFDLRVRAVKIAALAGIVLVLSLLGVKTFRQAGLWGRESRLWSYVLKQEPRSFFAYNSRGNLCMDDKNYEKAIADFSQAIRLRPDYALAYNNRGLAYYHNGQQSLALSDFNMALKLHYSNPDYTLVNRGLLYTQMGRTDLALKDLKKAVSLNPGNPYAYNNLGGIYFNQGLYDLAFENFNKALELKKDLVKAYVSRGNVYLKKNMPELAMRDYKTALGYDPVHAGAFYNRSLLYYMLKDYSAALDDVLKAKSLGFKVKESYIEDIKQKIGK